MAASTCHETYLREDIHFKETYLPIHVLYMSFVFEAIWPKAACWLFTAKPFIYGLIFSLPSRDVVGDFTQFK